MEKAFLWIKISVLILLAVLILSRLLLPEFRVSCTDEYIADCRAKNGTPVLSGKTGRVIDCLMEGEHE